MDSSQDKELPATERKLQKAREDGQGARSRDLSHLAILGAGAASILVLAPTLMDHLQKALSQQLVFDSRTVMTPGSMLERMQAVVMVGLVASVVFAHSLERPGALEQRETPVYFHVGLAL